MGLSQAMAGETMVTRFAPSPTFYLHAGHARAASVAWRRAREVGGRFLLRLEDIDAERCRPEYTAAILEDLRWLRCDWDGDVLVQSQRLPLYRACLDNLAQRSLIYPCFCSRAEIAASASAPHGPDGSRPYPGTCRALTRSERTARRDEGRPPAWRLNTMRALDGAPPLFFEEEGVGLVRAAPDSWGDVVLARRDAPASYHLCATYDDAAQGVTLVTRGEDLLPATHLHRLLQHLCGWPVPRYAHHALVKDASGERLSKRSKAPTLRDLRLAGVSAAEILPHAESMARADRSAALS